MIFQWIREPAAISPGAGACPDVFCLIHGGCSQLQCDIYICIIIIHPNAE
ncbi:MAG: hypothetical protein HXS46_07855 [Theionarchaea archaeon]|nr:hypothetical protein [Theionarchaea archaeon]